MFRLSMIQYERVNWLLQYEAIDVANLSRASQSIIQFMENNYVRHEKPLKIHAGEVAKKYVETYAVARNL